MTNSNDFKYGLLIVGTIPSCRTLLFYNFVLSSSSTNNNAQEKAVEISFEINIQHFANSNIRNMKIARTLENFGTRFEKYEGTIYYQTGKLNSWLWT